MLYVDIAVVCVSWVVREARKYRVFLSRGDGAKWREAVGEARA